MSRQPVLFVSHGAPDLLLQPGATGRLWQALGLALPRPTAILAVSAHWGSRQPRLGSTTRPATLHDFSGFPEALYRCQYPAPGAPELAVRAAALLTAAGIPATTDPERGLDHGAWAPLSLLHPAADIPVCQLALQPAAGPAWHLELGRTLAPLREEGVLILASGALTHNFGWLSWSPTATPYGPAEAFADWVGERLARNETAALLDYRRSAPHGAEAHPSEEHLHPLFVALGAGADTPPRRFSPGFSHGGLAMDAYLWGADALESDHLKEFAHVC